MKNPFKSCIWYFFGVSFFAGASFGGGQYFCVGETEGTSRSFNFGAETIRNGYKFTALDREIECETSIAPATGKSPRYEYQNAVNAVPSKSQESCDQFVREVLGGGKRDRFLSAQVMFDDDSLNNAISFEYGASIRGTKNQAAMCMKR